MAVRVSPISRGAAILIIALGVFTVLFVNLIAGIAFLALGAVLYALLYRFTAKLNAEVDRAEPSSSG
jgi:membrane protein implicated in regulation of membrane protease activity